MPPSLRGASSSFREKFAKWSSSNATKYDFEFQEKLHLLDAIRDHTKRLLERMTSLVHTFESTGNNESNRSAPGTSRHGMAVNKTRHHTQNMAEIFGKLGALLPNESGMTYGPNMLAAQEILNEVAKFERTLIKEVSDQVILPLTEFTKNELDRMFTQREALYQARKKMDISRGKMEMMKADDAYAAPTESDMASLRGDTVSFMEKRETGKLTKKDALEYKYKAKRLIHDEAMVAMEKSIDQLDEFTDHHLSCILFFMEQQQAFWEKCCEAIDKHAFI